MHRVSKARIACMVIGIFTALVGTTAGFIAIYALHNLVVGGTASEMTRDWVYFTASLATAVGGFAFSLAAWLPYLRRLRAQGQRR